MASGTHRIALACIAIGPWALAACPSSALAAEALTLGVEPYLGGKEAKRAYQPLANFIAEATGRRVELKTAYDFAEHWARIKKGGKYDLILDGPFYTDYLISQHRYTPLVKVIGVMSHSLATSQQNRRLGPLDLVGKKVATLPAPAPAGLLLLRMFPQPARQPYIHSTRSAEEALALAIEGRVSAAMVPTPVVSRAIERGTNLRVIATTEPVPHVTLSAGPEVDENTRQRISQALLEASATTAGRTMLQRLGFPEGFERTDAAAYRGYARYLTQYW